MNNWIWGAVAVALLVLVKTVWDVFFRQGRTNTDRLEPQVDTYETLDEIRVVSRAERRDNARRGVSLARVDQVVAVDAVGDAEELPANEELDTVRWSAPLVQEEDDVPVLSNSNVVSLETHKKTAAPVLEALTYNEDEPVDPLALSQSQSRVAEAADYVMLYIVPSHVPFDGELLMKTAYGYGLRFGEMAMFHRHEHPNGLGEVLFSMARADDTGTFDLETMMSEFIPAVTLFMALPNQQPALAFDMMLDTAKRLAAELHGVVLDRNQDPLNRQLIDHYREYVLEFSRRQMMSIAV